MPATVYSEVGTIQVTVKNPDGQVSNSLPFVVLPQPENLPALRLEKLSPAKTGKGQGFRFNEEAGFSAIIVRGVSFQPGAKVRFDGRESPRTFYRDDSILVAHVPGSVYGEVGIIQITVKNPDGQVSNSLPFVVFQEALDSADGGRKSH